MNRPPDDPARSKRQQRLYWRCWRQLRSRREALCAAQRVVQFFDRYRVLKRARTVALTIAAGAELDTAPLRRQLQARGVRVLVPYLRGGRMVFRHHLPQAALRPGAHGIATPVRGAQVPLSRAQVLLLPLVAYDIRGYRLGQGGGYFDRALAALPKAARTRRIALAYAGQCAAELPIELWDQPLDAILSERGLHRFPLTRCPCVTG